MYPLQRLPFLILSSIQSIRNNNPSIAILVLSEDEEPGSVFEVLKAGVQGYLLRDEPPVKILNL